MLKNDGPERSTSYWTLFITVITFIIAALFSLLAEFATQNSGMIIAVLLLFILIIINVIFDSIAIAFTSCDKAPLASMAARRVKGSKIAVKLKSHAEKVSSICADVIGDICGIVSGAFVIVIVYKISAVQPLWSTLVITIVLSSVVASLTVGGKAFMKGIAMENSREIVMGVSKLIGVFVREGKL